MLEHSSFSETGGQHRSRVSLGSSLDFICLQKIHRHLAPCSSRLQDSSLGTETLGVRQNIMFPVGGAVSTLQNASPLLPAWEDGDSGEDLLLAGEYFEAQDLYPLFMP